MARKSFLASAISLALLPNIAGALQLGGISTQSALNAPFVGRIHLLDVQPEELDAVEVSLASDAEFSKAGASRPDFLTRLDFLPEVSSAGRTVIRVSSADPVREPYLDFLIQVKWPEGSVIKEYTVLLDPPGTTSVQPPRIEQPVMQRPPPQAKPEKPPASSADGSAFPMRRGPVAAGSSLLRIARRMAPAAGASLAQTTMALYRSNQEAFIRGDINKLKVDEILEIPSAAELFALDEEAAERELAAALRGEKVTSAPLKGKAATPEAEPRLEIAGTEKPAAAAQAPVEGPPVVPSEETPTTEAAGLDRASEAASEEPSEHVAARIEEGPAGGETEPALGSLKDDLLLVQEAGESTRQETEELRSRIHELEAQLADIQRLLALRNEQFARLQQAELEQPETLGTEGMEAPSSEVSAGAEIAETERVQTLEAPAVPVAPPPEASQSRLEDSGSQAVPAPSFWESIPRSVWTLALAVPLLLLLLGWIIKQRRKSLEEMLTPNKLAPAFAGAAATAGAPSVDQALVDQASEEAVASGQSSFPHSGFASLEEMEEDEADVLSEADVYIAYGRYREAESLLEEEVEKSPDRLDVKYKLADAYYGARNLQGIELLREQIQGVDGDRINPDQWQRLETMLRDLKGADDEGPHLDRGGLEGPTSAVIEPIRRQDTTVPLSSLGDGISETGEAELDLTDGSRAVVTELPELGRRDRPARDSDLELLGGGRASPETEETLDLSGATSDLEIRLDDLDSLKDLDLSSFAMSESAEERVSEDVLSAISDDSQVDSLDIETESRETPSSDLPFSQWQTDSGMWDEAATKIDLARAYLEMEDPDAARVILEEVTQEGNEEQRVAAREMLAQLS